MTNYENPVKLHLHAYIVDHQPPERHEVLIPQDSPLGNSKVLNAMSHGCLLILDIPVIYCSILGHVSAFRDLCSAYPTYGVAQWVSPAPHNVIGHITQRIIMYSVGSFDSG